MNPLRVPSPSDVEEIKQLAIDAEIFAVHEVGFFDEMLAGYFDGSLSEDRWWVAEGPDGAVHAAAYVAPEPFGDRVWNVYFIAVAPGVQGQGLGTLLLEAVERDLRAMGEVAARIVVIETSSTEQYQQARCFYRARGYDEEARIREFYGPSDDKIVFWKSLTGPV